MKDEYNVKKLRLLKSCKATLQKKKNCDKNQEKNNFVFTGRRDGIDSYSNKEIKRYSKSDHQEHFFGFCRFEGNVDSGDDDWTP